MPSDESALKELVQKQEQTNKLLYLAIEELKEIKKGIRNLDNRGRLK
jgi:hypothetical protein